MDIKKLQQPSGMSHGLAPSKSTVYVSNLPFQLKNNDLHKIFDKYGRIIKVTVMKEKESRKSKGVAFIQYLSKEDALKCVQGTNSKNMFGRTLKASIAKDNGRSTEFIRKKVYPDKSYCFECGDKGHLSYKCVKNLLGAREPPTKRVRLRNKDSSSTKTIKDDERGFESEDDYETLSAAIALEQEKRDSERGGPSTTEDNQQRRRFKRSTYFSDEEESE